jgi:hypothetical protein
LDVDVGAADLVVEADAEDAVVVLESVEDADAVDVVGTAVAVEMIEVVSVPASVPGTDTVAL